MTTEKGPSRFVELEATSGGRRESLAVNKSEKRSFRSLSPLQSPRENELKAEWREQKKKLGTKSFSLLFRWMLLPSGGDEFGAFIF